MGGIDLGHGPAPAGPQVVGPLERPKLQAMGSADHHHPILAAQGAGLATLGPMEAFMAYMKVSFLCGFIIGSPWIFWQLSADVTAVHGRKDEPPEIG